jgi:hypothetical protein
LNFQIVTESPSWLILICLLAGFLYSWLLYRKDTSFAETAKWIKGAMAVFRFVVVSILAILLLSPLIKSVFNITEKPVVVIIQDESASVKSISDSSDFLKNYPAQLTALQNELAADFDVRLFSAGDQVREGISNEFIDKESDLSAGANEIKARFSGRNLGAVILATDGLFNKGSNPLYAYDELKVPVYTIGLGDTTIRKDIVINKVRHNKAAFFGNSFPVEITLDARQCQGQRVTVKINRNDKEIYSKVVELDKPRVNLIIPVVLEADQKGVNHYVATVTEVDGEISYENNQADFFVEVSDNRQLVMIIANAPHPDLAAIKDILEKNPNYEVTIAMAGDQHDQIATANLVILHQLPSVNQPATAILDKIAKQEIPVWYILGSQTNVTAFNKLETGVRISENRGNLNEIQAGSNTDFSYFTMEEEHLSRTATMPPLICPFGTYEATGAIQSLLTQRIGSVKTAMPLLYFKVDGNIKTGVLTGEGLWKWKLNEFSTFNEAGAVSALVTKSVQFLANREKRTPFRLTYKNSFTENEQVIIDAALYNPSGELINTPDARLNIIDETGKTFAYTFSKTEKSYSLIVGYLPVGHYKINASTKLGTESYSEVGSFTVTALQAELAETIANHQVLASLAAKTGGEFYTGATIKDIAKSIKSRADIKAVSYEQKRLDDVINLKWIFGLIMLLLSLEWFFRKRSGSY